MKAANLALRFLLEVSALVALGYWGFHAGDGDATHWILGIGAPLVAAVVWGLFVAPRRRFDYAAAGRSLARRVRIARSRWFRRAHAHGSTSR